MAALTSTNLVNLTQEARRRIVEMSFRAGASHVPSALSMVDYLAVLFTRFVSPMDHRFVLAKPFGAQAYYALFALLGWGEYHPFTEQDLPGKGACITREDPNVFFFDDTIGNSLSVACGIAMAGRSSVYVNSSDAALQTGTFWEAAMFAGHRRLSNILLTIDCNGMQVLGTTREILDLGPVAQRLCTIGWRAVTVDGHDLEAIGEALSSVITDTKGPRAVVCNTTKGYGIPFMENDLRWHYRPLDDDSYDRAMALLS